MDGVPWIPAATRIRWPAASGPSRSRSWLIALISCGASWSSNGNKPDRLPPPMSGASIATAAGFTLRMSPSSAISNSPTGHW
jgi:hypothetical protein